MATLAAVVNVVIRIGYVKEARNNYPGPKLYSRSSVWIVRRKWLIAMSHNVSDKKMNLWARLTIDIYRNPHICIQYKARH